jgi:glucosamine--fructose-6-phosphate aminotransferase (isomerizing)
VFASQTDTEVVAHLVHSYLTQGVELVSAVRRASAQLKGAFALAILASTHPTQVIAARRTSPLLVGLADEGAYLASDASALVAHTRRHIHLRDGDVAVLSCDGVQVFDSAGASFTPPVHVSMLDSSEVSRGEHPDFMTKEIREQPMAVARTLASALQQPELRAEMLGAHAGTTLRQVRHIRILACGTSYYAGSVARHWIEEVAGVPCSVEIASEYRYRKVAEPDGTLIVAISQSGETADTLAAVEKARDSGCLAILALCNVPESSLTRVADLVMLTKAGPEIGVASTKAFTTQLASLRTLSLMLAQEKGQLSDDDMVQHKAQLAQLPSVIDAVFAHDKTLAKWGRELAKYRSALFLGRGASFPVAQEGALKLKEISYIHAEAYPAGELKHGPLALVDDQMPVVVLATRDHTLDKLMSNVEEVQARAGKVFGIIGQGIQFPEQAHTMTLPSVAPELEPVAQVVALQLLAYHAARSLDRPVDRPRNLAKSVTTE